MYTNATRIHECKIKKKASSWSLVKNSHCLGVASSDHPHQFYVESLKVILT